MVVAALNMRFFLLRNVAITSRNQGCIFLYFPDGGGYGLDNKSGK